MQGAPSHNRSSLLAAFFLASSWTWVVGMWLPVILVRHFGWPGWVAFAVPNVAGAMSVGLVYRTRGASEAFVARRLLAMRAFSNVTLALHAFVLTWVFVRIGVWTGLHPIVALIALGMLWTGAAAFSRASFRVACYAGAGVWLGSVAMLVFAWTTDPARALPQTTGDARPVELLFLAPVLVFGFALCPFLDLTIHRARQETPGAAGTRAFVLGYGVLFLAMILGTLTYAQGWIDARALSFYVCAHLAAQSWFTLSLHLRALRDAVPAPSAKGGSTHAGLTPLLVGMALGLAPTSAIVTRLLGSTPLSGLVSFDAIYRVFMACYGLAFPGLLWAWSASRRDDRATTLLAAIGIALAAPFFWLGFLEGRWIWLPVGLALVLLAGALPMVLPGWSKQAAISPRNGQNAG